jgi:hypothetical protein
MAKATVAKIFSSFLSAQNDYTGSVEASIGLRILLRSCEIEIEIPAELEDTLRRWEEENGRSF